MSKFVVFIRFNDRRKQELEIDPNDSIRSLMTQIFDKFNIPESKRDYCHNKFLLLFNDIILNANEDCLNKTIKEASIEDYDTIDLKECVSLNVG